MALGAGLEERLYVSHDANFNVTSIIGLDGSTWEVIERYVYDPYGERTVLNADWTVDTDGLSDFTFVHGHQGGRHYLATGLVDFRNRHLDTSLGRWERQDPMGYVDGPNAYINRNSSPVTHLDPRGLQAGDDGGNVDIDGRFEDGKLIAVVTMDEEAFDTLRDIFDRDDIKISGRIRIVIKGPLAKLAEGYIRDQIPGWADENLDENGDIIPPTGKSPGLPGVPDIFDGSDITIKTKIRRFGFTYSVFIRVEDLYVYTYD